MHELTFEFTDGEVVGPLGPSVSYDRINWSWLENSTDHLHFTYLASQPGQTVYFCFSIPYLLADFDRFTKSLPRMPMVDRKVLCLTEQGFECPLLVIGNKTALKHIVLTCRHHACESTASYVLEGVIEHLVSLCDASEILQEYCFHIVPFVDLDGVENGDQGKSRDPHDHNRDYISQPIFKSTAAIMRYCQELRVVFFLDLHCPWKWNVYAGIFLRYSNGCSTFQFK